MVALTLNDVTVEEINQKLPLERTIMKENNNKFYQTEGSCPLTNNPRLYLDLGQYGDGPSVPEVLCVSYQCPSGTTPTVVTFLWHLQRPSSVSITTSTSL